MSLQRSSAVLHVSTTVRTHTQTHEQAWECTCTQSFALTNTLKLPKVYIPAIISTSVTNEHAINFTIIRIKEVVDFPPLEKPNDVDNGIDVSRTDAEVVSVAVGRLIAIGCVNNVRHVQGVAEGLDDVKRFGRTTSHNQEHAFVKLVAD